MPRTDRANNRFAEMAGGPLHGRGAIEDSFPRAIALHISCKQTLAYISRRRNTIPRQAPRTSRDVRRDQGQDVKTDEDELVY